MTKVYLFGFYIFLVTTLVLAFLLLKMNPTKLNGQLTWSDIYSNNSSATVNFFSTVFGTQAQKVEMPDNLDYTMLKAKKSFFPSVGVMQITDQFREQGLLPHSTPYFAVTDYEQTHQKMIENGAKVLRPAMIKNGMKFGIYLIPGDLDIAIIQFGGNFPEGDNDADGDQ